MSSDDRRADDRAPRTAAVILVLTALAGSILIAGAPPGLGISLTLVLVLAGLVVAGTVRGREQIAWGTLAVGLAVFATVRDARWVITLAVLGSVWIATIFATRPATRADLVAAPLRVATRSLRAPGFLRRGLAANGMGHVWAPLVRGATIAIVLLLVFGTLFATADRAFAHLASRYLLPDLDVALLPARFSIFAAVALLGTSLLATTPRFAQLGPEWPGLRAMMDLGLERGAPRRLRRWEWVAPLACLDLLFLAFVVLQIAVLFGGHDHVLRTAGLTYAEYAREGFFQLIVVGALTLGVVGGATRWAHRDRRADRILLRLLLGALCVLALVVLASALRRLGLYEETFGLTRARYMAAAIIFWLGGMLSLAMAAGTIGPASWLPRAVIAVTALGVLVLAAVDPDARIAERNVERFHQTGKIDLDYLSGLSADAVRPLSELPPALRGCVLTPIAQRLGDADPIGGWNIAREQARAIIAATDLRCR